MHGKIYVNYQKIKKSRGIEVQLSSILGPDMKPKFPPIHNVGHIKPVLISWIIWISNLDQFAPNLGPIKSIEILRIVIDPQSLRIIDYHAQFAIWISFQITFGAHL